MSDFHMVAALAYTTNLDLQLDFTTAREEHLVPIGWKEVDDQQVLRVCAGIADMAPLRFRVGDLAKRLREKSSLINDAFIAVARAAGLFARAGVRSPMALPYSWQLITLAIRLHEMELAISEAEHEAIVRWFWLTTYGEVFAGVNSAVYKRSDEALAEMIRGEAHKVMERDMRLKLGEPTRSDFRSVRAKACALAMARHQDGGRLDGPSHRALADHGAQAMQILFSKGMRSKWQHLAIVTPDLEIGKLRQVLQRRADGASPEPGDEAILRTLAIPENVRGSIDHLLEERRRFLAEKEGGFVARLNCFTWESSSG
ncbi:MAG: hypothetical protein ABIK09_11905 [Pseudomonadota bacterium]